MRQRYTWAEYENLWRSDPQRYGCVHFHHAMDSLQMDARSIAMLIDKGILECLDVGDDSSKGSMITLASLLVFKEAKAVSPQADRWRRILEVLTEAARNKKTLAYGDVLESMGLAYADATDRQKFQHDLRRATRHSELFAHGLLISALLVFRTQPMAEDDFFVMAKELGMFKPGKDSKTVFFRDHLERIFQYYERTGDSGATQDK